MRFELVRLERASGPPRASGKRAAWTAQVIVPTKVRARPGSGRTLLRLSTTMRWHADPVKLLVLATASGPNGSAWYHVLLPRRPNGSSSWVDAAAVRTRRTPWRIDVSLRKRSVRLLRHGRVFARARAVIGTRATPTPRGLFAVYELIREPRPATNFLGTQALLLTAYSNVLQRFGGGPGQVAIHGRAGASLATPLGSAASHGCVRVDNAAIDRMALVAGAGTPVRIHR